MRLYLDFRPIHCLEQGGLELELNYDLLDLSHTDQMFVYAAIRKTMKYYEYNFNTGKFFFSGYGHPQVSVHWQRCFE